MQANVFDARGLVWRAPTRSYRGNSLDYRNMHLARALQVLETAEDNEASSDWMLVRGRLLLAERLLGGVVSNDKARKFGERDLAESEEDRGANWDLLRQAAETNRLIFDPMPSADGAIHQVILWVSRQDLGNEPRKFDSSFLQISDPWTDARLRSYRGYTTTRNFDGEHVEAIPLALYSLDYPRVPLLLIDFRDEWKAKRREMTRRAASEIVTGVMGITGWGNWSYLGAKFVYQWVRDRHGAALDRTRRLEAYARLRQTLLERDCVFDARFRGIVESRLDAIALNPFEQGAESEEKLVKRQHEALIRWFEGQ